MLRRRVVVSGLCLAVVTASCSLFTDLSGFAGGADAGHELDADTLTGADSAVAIDAGADSGAAIDAGADAASCACPGLVSTYLFADPNELGHDAIGNNHMTKIVGAPKPSTATPPGLDGHSLQLDGSSSVCITSGFSFDTTADHTLCWWSQPAVLGDKTNQFAQECGYDTWTASSGADYLWRINNCNSGTPADLQVPSVYAAGKWVQICQTYTRKTMTRAVVIDGDVANKHSVTDPVPIVESPSAQWCIGSYGGGGYWNGVIYRPMWFDRVLGDAEIQAVSKTACCPQ